MNNFLSEYEKRLQNNAELVEILETLGRGYESFLSEETMNKLCTVLMKQF